MWNLFWDKLINQVKINLLILGQRLLIFLYLRKTLFHVISWLTYFFILSLFFTFLFTFILLQIMCLHFLPQENRLYCPSHQKLNDYVIALTSDVCSLILIFNYLEDLNKETQLILDLIIEALEHILLKDVQLWLLSFLRNIL